MSNTRSENAVKNIIYNLSFKIITLLLAFISRTVFIWGFGIEYLGLNGLFSDILNLMSLADLGFGIAMVYSFYEPLARKDYDKLSALVNFYKKVYAIIAAAVLVIGILLVPFLKYIINLPEDIPLMYVYYFFSLANVLASYICVYKTSILTADQKNYVIVKVTMVTNILKSILQIISVLLLKNYIIYLAIGTIGVIVGNLYASGITTKEYPMLKSTSELSQNEKKGIFENLSSVFIIKIASVILNATDNIIISVIIGTIAVGYYSNYLMIQTNIMGFYTLVFSALTASIGNLIVTESYEKRYEVFSSCQTIGFMASSVIVPCYVSMINSFISLWLGNEYTFDNLVVIAIGVNMYLSCVLQPLWSYREATGLYKKTKWAMVACAVLNIVLSIALGRIIGVAGIIFASAISRLLTYFWYEPTLLFKEFFNKKTSGYYFEIAKNFFMISIICVLAMYINNKLNINSFFDWIINASMLFIVSSVCAFLVYRKTEGMQVVLVYIKKLRKTK